MNKNTIIGIVVVVIVGVGLYFMMKKPAVVLPPPADTTGNTQNQTPPPPVVTPPVIPGEVYTDPTSTFSFSHPTAYPVKAGDATKPWSANSTIAGKQLAVVTIPKTFQPSTNFSEATFTVGVSSAAKAIQTCLTAANGEQVKGQTNLHGVIFEKFTLSDAGAGNFYDTTSYRAVQNSQCYAVEYIIHSTNIGNYPPELGIKQFSVTDVTNMLEGMTNSFSFYPSTKIQTSFVGTWTGPEGTSLIVSKTGTVYTLSFVMLDGPIKVTGKETTKGITFTRGGKTLTLKHGSGQDTGMKYLTTKLNCLVVQPSEGYCKD